MYRIELELREAGLKQDAITSIIADVRDPDRIGRIMAQHRPDFVFHAAALKHVPALEANPAEGILSNVLGTCNVADAAVASDVRVLTFISTDKAVDPSNVLGATKRIAESYCQSLDLASVRCASTRFLAVRFGNVAGSSGSVIPLFQRQIARGGPITVTHPDVHRFFMTVEEAVELVLQATSFGLDRATPRGRIYVLDMGEPIRIAELAAQMIRLAGLSPGRDVDIRFVGLRPGEKLGEILFRSTETITRTKTPQVLAAGSPVISYPLLRSMIDDLAVAARQHDEVSARRLLAVTLNACDAPPGSAGPEQSRPRYSAGPTLAAAAVEDV